MITESFKPGQTVKTVDSGEYLTFKAQDGTTAITETESGNEFMTPLTNIESIESAYERKSKYNGANVTGYDAPGGMVTSDADLDQYGDMQNFFLDEAYSSFSDETIEGLAEFVSIYYRDSDGEWDIDEFSSALSLAGFELAQPLVHQLFRDLVAYDETGEASVDRPESDDELDVELGHIDDEDFPAYEPASKKERFLGESVDMEGALKPGQIKSDAELVPLEVYIREEIPLPKKYKDSIPAFLTKLPIPSGKSQLEAYLYGRGFKVDSELVNKLYFAMKHWSQVHDPELKENEMDKANSSRALFSSTKYQSLRKGGQYKCEKKMGDFVEGEVVYVAEKYKLGNGDIEVHLKSLRRALAEPLLLQGKINDVVGIEYRKEVNSSVTVEPGGEGCLQKPYRQVLTQKLMDTGVLDADQAGVATLIELEDLAAQTGLDLSDIENPSGVHVGAGRNKIRALESSRSRIKSAEQFTIEFMMEGKEGSTVIEADSETDARTIAEGMYPSAERVVVVTSSVINSSKESDLIDQVINEIDNDSDGKVPYPEAHDIAVEAYEWFEQYGVGADLNDLEQKLKARADTMDPNDIRGLMLLMEAEFESSVNSSATIEGPDVGPGTGGVPATEIAPQRESGITKQDLLDEEDFGSFIVE